MTTIWHSSPDLATLNHAQPRRLQHGLGIVFSEIGDDFLRATMPVDDRTRQPLGLLHGGASAVLAETVASVAGNLCVDLSEGVFVGLQINVNHMRAVRDGTVTATARPLHRGRQTQVWNIDIHDAQQRLCATSRLTLARARPPA